MFKIQKMSVPDRGGRNPEIRGPRGVEIPKSGKNPKNAFLIGKNDQKCDLIGKIEKRLGTNWTKNPLYAPARSRFFDQFWS